MYTREDYCKFASAFYRQIYCQNHYHTDFIQHDHCHNCGRPEIFKKGQQHPSKSDLGVDELGWVIIGTTIALFFACICFLIHGLIKWRKRQRQLREEAQRQRAPGLQFARRTLEHGPLPYLHDLNPPEYNGLVLDESDLPSYNEVLEEADLPNFQKTILDIQSD